MDVRCAVETCAEFGFSGATCTPRIRCGLGTDVFLCTGSDEVYIFSTEGKILTAILQFPGPVSDLVQSHDKQCLYVACRSGVYCVSLQLLLSRVESSPADASSELKISSESLVAAEEGVSSLLLVGSVLLTLSQRDESWMLTLYKSSNYEKLSSFSQVSGVGHTEGKTMMRRSPVLICVYASDALSSIPNSSSNEAPNEGHFHLDSVLFKLLFGIDVALAKSPIILCGLPDGCLCFLPLRLPGSRLRVLHSLEQPVVFVGASIATKTSPGQCLVALGELGRVVVIKADKGGSSEARGNITALIEGCVPGPVVCGCVDKNTLYYSTGSDLLLLELSERKSGGEGQERPTCNTAGVVELLALSVRGRLRRIKLPVRTEDDRLSSVSNSQVGRSVRDLLSAIGDVCERASVLKTSIKSKNQILQHLNQVLNISYLLMAGETLEVSLPLRAAGDPSFPVTVSCSLLFSLTSLLGEEAANLLALQISCISLPLNTLTVDWLHALQVSSHKAVQEKITPQATDPTEAFLRSCRLRKVEGGGEGALKYLASVRVSAELLRDTLMVKKSSDFDPLATNVATENVCLSLLEWLLSEGPGGVTTGQKGDKVSLSDSVVQAQGPNRQTVKLTAKEVYAGEEESLATVEVQVQSSSIAAVCGLHHAVLRRVQTLLQRAPERAASTKSVQSLGLRQALQRAEHLLQQIQQSRVSEVFGGGVSTGQMSRTLLNVYREMRENPLVII
ncbi:hypothetical protein PBY51_001481 [Eleginops maclovinus]|uniref:Fanconi anemia core complex-associated protein 100 n=1 Tax=Eleginops maclovinus TaxID=56733 RepID=A0AAN8A606_ELEMC|nr:hypothetical protein PBY51_001481 [Eleginops maclovinus]